MLFRKYFFRKKVISKNAFYKKAMAKNEKKVL